METQNSYEASVRNAEKLLITNVFVEIDKIKKYMEDLNSHPEKALKYSKTLAEILSRHESEAKHMSNDEKKDLVAMRLNEWEENFGSLPLADMLMLCKQWNVSIGDVLNEEMTPALIKRMLDIYIIGQEDYKRQLAMSFFVHQMKDKLPNGISTLPKANLLVCGPSGSGKTYGLQILSQLFNQPMIIIHCNSLVQEGIIGSSIADYFTSAYLKNKSVEKMKELVVFFDEFDKLYEKGHYNETVLNEILSVIDDNGEIRFAESHERSSNYITIPTRDMMFVFTGVFAGLDKIISGQKLGFGNADSCEAQDTKITPDHLLKYGIKPEIIGRIQNFTMLSAPTVNEFVAILDSDQSSPFNEMRSYFTANGIDAVLTDDGKKALAQIACERSLGVRGVKSLLQQVLNNDMFELDIPQGQQLVISEQYINEHLN